jgi:hypothetical protein
VVVVRPLGGGDLAVVEQPRLLRLHPVHYYSSYGPAGGIGLLVVLFIIFWLVIGFAGPHWGWYGWSR